MEANRIETVLKVSFPKIHIEERKNGFPRRIGSDRMKDRRVFPKKAVTAGDVPQARVTGRVGPKLFETTHLL